MKETMTLYETVMAMGQAAEYEKSEATLADTPEKIIVKTEGETKWDYDGTKMSLSIGYTDDFDIDYLPLIFTITKNRKKYSIDMILDDDSLRHLSDYHSELSDSEKEFDEIYASVFPTDYDNDELYDQARELRDSLLATNPEYIKALIKKYFYTLDFTPENYAGVVKFYGIGSDYDDDEICVISPADTKPKKVLKRFLSDYKNDIEEYDGDDMVFSIREIIVKENFNDEFEYAEDSFGYSDELASTKLKFKVSAEIE